MWNNNICQVETTLLTWSLHVILQEVQKFVTSIQLLKINSQWDNRRLLHRLEVVWASSSLHHMLELFLWHQKHVINNRSQEVALNGARLCMLKPSSQRNVFEVMTWTMKTLCLSQWPTDVWVHEALLQGRNVALERPRKEMGDEPVKEHRAAGPFRWLEWTN